MRLIWFHADNEGKNTIIQSDLRADVRRWRKQAKMKQISGIFGILRSVEK